MALYTINNLSCVTHGETQNTALFVTDDDQIAFLSFQNYFSHRILATSVNLNPDIAFRFIHNTTRACVKLLSETNVFLSI
jgi:hypothetical protein